MINLGLSANRMQVLIQRLLGSHQIQTNVHLLDMNMNFMSDITTRLLDGSVDFDADSGVTRSTKLELLDLDSSLYFSLYDPSVGAHYFKQMVRVWYGVGALGPNPDWIFIPIFTGPIVDASRNGATLSVTGMGKEVLAQDGMWSPWQWPPGWGKRDVVANGLALHCGERFFDIDAVGGVLGSVFSVDIGDDLWNAFWELIDDMGCQMYYNGWGNLRIRARPLNPVFTFNDQSITDKPQISYNADDLVNAVRVEGGIRQGTITPWVSTIIAPASHPLSPAALGRGGTARLIPEFISDSSLLTGPEVTALAQKTLLDRLLSSVEASFTSLAIPFLEEGDVVVINGEDYYGLVRTSKMSIPLVGDPEMSFGFLSSSYGLRSLSGAVSSLTAPLVDPKLIEAQQKNDQRQRDQMQKEQQRNRDQKRKKRRIKTISPSKKRRRKRHGASIEKG